MSIFTVALLCRLIPLVVSHPTPDSDGVNFEIQIDGGREELVLPCPNGADFCEDVQDYPTGQTRSSQSLTVSNQLRSAFNRSAQRQPDVGVRIFGFETDFVEESRACDVRKSTIYPRKAKTLGGQFRFVLNNKEFVQSLEIEQCINEGNPCRVDTDAPQEGSTVCRQKYASYQLLALDRNGNEIVDSFRLPSACICHHVRGLFDDINPFELRFGAPALPFCKDKSKAKEKENFQIEITNTTPRPLNLQTTTPAVVFPTEPYRSNSKINFMDSAAPQQESPGRNIRYRRDVVAVSAPKAVSAPIRVQRTNDLQANGCANRRYCENSLGYPSDLINNIVETETKIPSRIKNKLIKQACIDMSELIGTRQFNIDESQLCQAARRIIIPTEALNIRNEWKYVVNSANHTQSIEIEECSTNARNGGIQVDDRIIQDFGSCMYSGVRGNSPESTTCKQLYREHKLLVVTQEGELELDSFSLPSSCACFMRSDFQDLEFRRGN